MSAPDPRAWLDQVDARDDPALVAAYATTALRAVLDLCDTKGFGQVLFPDDIRTAITTALEDA